MSEQELAALAKGAEGMAPPRRQALREKLPHWSDPEQLTGVAVGLGAACGMLAADGGVPQQLADLAAVAAADALHYRAEVARIRAEAAKPASLAEFDRIDALIASGKAKGVPIDQAIREMEEWLAKKRQAGLEKAG